MNSFGQIYLLAWKNAEAIPELEKAISLSGGSQRANAGLGFAYARLGKRNEALKLLNSLKERSKLRYVSQFEFALIYGGLGERDRALDYLERASEDPDRSMNLLRLNPAFSDLHAEPRFTELVRRVGLPRKLGVPKMYDSVTALRHRPGLNKHRLTETTWISPFIGEERIRRFWTSGRQAGSNPDCDMGIVPTSRLVVSDRQCSRLTGSGE